MPKRAIVPSYQVFYCDSCLRVIPPGTHVRQIRGDKPRARSRKHAMLIARGVVTPRNKFRHVGCPEPHEQVTCPTCERGPGMPCALPIRGPDGSVIDHGRDFKRPHRTRTLKAQGRTPL